MAGHVPPRIHPRADVRQITELIHGIRPEHRPEAGGGLWRPGRRFLFDIVANKRNGCGPGPGVQAAKGPSPPPLVAMSREEPGAGARGPGRYLQRGGRYLHHTASTFAPFRLATCHAAPAILTATMHRAG
jgi:hypothetical protein